MIRLSPKIRPLLVTAALLYLSLPVALFLWGWVEPVVAWPAILLLVAGGVAVVRAVPGTPLNVGKRDLFALAATLLGCLFLLELLAGFFGQAPQPGDFLFRNAMYETLVRSDWPLWSARGEYFVYYHCFCLPPALAAKAVGCSTALLYAWSYAGLALCFCLFFLKLKGRVSGLFLLLCLLGCVTEWGVTGGTGFLEAHGMPAAANALQALFPVQNMSYVAWGSQVTWTYNHAIPLCVFMGLLMSGILPLRHRFYAAALVVPASPLASLCLLPLLLLQMLPACRRKGGVRSLLTSPSLWYALPCVGLAALYFRTGEGTSVGTVFPHLLQPGMLQAYSVCILWTLLPLLFFLHPYRRSAYYISAVVLCLLLPSIVVGAADEGSVMGVRNNELLYKGSLLLFLPLAWLYLHRWRHASHALRLAMALYLCASAGMIFWRGLKGINHYTWNTASMQENIRSAWGGHLDHPEDALYPSFWSARPVHPPLRQNKTRP